MKIVGLCRLPFVFPIVGFKQIRRGEESFTHVWEMLLNMSLCEKFTRTDVEGPFIVFFSACDIIHRSKEIDGGAGDIMIMFRLRKRTGLYQCKCWRRAVRSPARSMPVPMVRVTLISPVGCSTEDSALKESSLFPPEVNISFKMS